MTDFDYRDLITNGVALDEKEFPPLHWSVHGLIPEGFGLLTGPPKAGKSWFVGGIALDVASGRPALGKIKGTRSRPVLYLALEDGERRLQGRCRKLLGPGVAIPALLDFVTKASPQNVFAIVGAWLDDHRDDNALVILDTLGRVMPNSTPGESAYSRDYRIGAQLKGLTDRHPGSTLIVVHHVRKAAGDDWMDSTSGTNGLNGAADFTINLSRNRNEDTGILKVTGRDVPEGEYAVRTDDGSWTLQGEELAEAAALAEQARATADLGDRSAELLSWVAAQQNAVTPREAEVALAFPDARRYLARLAESGRLQKVGRGRYSCVPTVPSVPTDDLFGTEGTHGTPGAQKCSICGFPMSHDDGTGTHPTCGAA